MFGADGSSDTCRFQSISICRSRSGASRFTGSGWRRSWSAAEKAAIIDESYGAGETICAVARRYGLTPRQLFTWRRLARQSAETLPPMFVPAVVQPSQPEPPIRIRTVSPRRARRRRSRSDGIELEIAGVEVRVGPDAKPRTIEAVIQALKATS
jgi:transposase